MYSEKVMDHFRNPRNMGELPDADVVGEARNSTCSDLIYLYIKVEKKNGMEIIKDISFQTFGCAAAIATSSMITELVKGISLEDAMNITRDNVATSLGGLPEKKLECSNLAADGLHDAIRKYYKNE